MGKKAKKAKKMKDPNAPKRPAGAYFLYVKDVRPAVASRMDSSNVTAIGKKIGQMWRNLSDEEKSRYTATAQKMKNQWQREMAAYKNSAGFAAFQAKKEGAMPVKAKKKAARRVARKVK